MPVVDPGLPPEEAIRALRVKGYVLGHDWRDISAEEHAVGFTVAKAAKLDLLADIRGGVDKALAEGTTLDQFQDDLEPLLRKHDWWGRAKRRDLQTGEERIVQLGSPRQLRTIFETNLRVSYAAGRWDRIQRVKDRFAYLRYSAVQDGRTRPEHTARHGTILPVDDPWWNTHYPPNGWGCRCRVIQVSESMMQRRGWKPSESPRVVTRRWRNKRTDTTVDMPEGIDPGWAYNPGDDDARRAEVSRLLTERLARLPSPQHVYEWDEGKRRDVRRDRKVDFAAMRFFKWDTAEYISIDTEDGEEGQTLDGLIDGKLHRVVYTERDGRIRVITMWPRAG